MSSPPGSLLSQRYEMRELVGSDGAMEVYRAMDLRLGRDVAITVLEIWNLHGTEEFLRFEREAQIRAALHHPRITTIHDFGHDASRIFLVAEWMEGQSLRRRLRDGFLTWAEARSMGREVLDGLRDIHKQGYVLGAFDAASVFLEIDGHAKLFAYRIQKNLGTEGEASAHTALDDLKALARLLLASVGPRGGHPQSRSDRRVLETLEAWAEGRPARAAMNFTAFHALLQDTHQRNQSQPMLWLAASILVTGISISAALFSHRWFKPPPLSIAILPFQNAEANPELEYLGPSLAHALANELRRVPGIRVTQMGEGSAQIKEPMSLALQMGADLALTGHYRMREGRLTVDTQLLKARDGTVYAQCHVERPSTELLFLTADLENRVLDSIDSSRRFGAETQFVGSETKDPEAYRLYLQGLHLLNTYAPDGYEKAQKCFQDTIARDPHFAPAHAGLSDCYALMGFWSQLPAAEAESRAKESALKALEMDPGLAQAHASLANIRFRYELDWKGAEDEFRLALHLDPNDSKTHHWYGNLLLSLGQWDDSLAHMRRALELDPLSLPCRVNFAINLHWAGRSTEAIQEIDKALSQDPTSRDVLVRLWQVLEETDRLEDALMTVDKLTQLNVLSEGEATALRNAYAGQGHHGYWEERVRQEEHRTPIETVHLASAVAMLGDRDRTFRLLERALRERSPYLVYVPKNPAFDALKQDLRFAQFLQRIGYPPH